MRGGEAGQSASIGGVRPPSAATRVNGAQARGESSPTTDEPEGEPSAQVHAAAEASAATYRDVLAVREFRNLYLAHALSLLGDQLAKVALSLLVFSRTGSTLLTASTYAISYLPWIAGGPVLSAIADRMRRRRVLIVCDLARAALIGLLAIPGMHISVLLVILLAASMFGPPFESARSALTPLLLEGDRYVVGSSMFAFATQLGAAMGFLAGGALVALMTPRGALVVDAGTFVASALVIVVGVRARAAAPSETDASPWQQVTAGARLVFSDVRLRAMLLVVWTAAAFGFAWEGIVAPLVAQLHGPDWQVGLLLGAGAAGIAFGAVVVVRACPPRIRNRIMLPCALLQQLFLVLTLIDHHIAIAVVAFALSGLASAFLVPLNAAFMRAVPDHLRGRAFGVAQGGLQTVQGLSLVAAGAVADVLAPSTTIAIFGLAGAAVLVPLVLSKRITVP